MVETIIFLQFKEANIDDCTIEFVIALSPDEEEKMSKSFVEYESSHGIDVNYKAFAIIARDTTGSAMGIVHAYTAFAEIYVDDMWVEKSFRGQGYGKKCFKSSKTILKEKALTISI